MIQNNLEKLEKLVNSELASRIQKSKIDYKELLFEINEDDLIEVIQFLKSNDKCKFKQLIDIAGVDHPEDEKRFKFFLGSSDVLISQLEGKLVDLLLCNTLAPVLEELAPNFGDFLLPNGRAFLSGLLVNQAPKLIKLLEDLGWEVSPCIKKDNWGLLEIKGQTPDRK